MRYKTKRDAIEQAIIPALGDEARNFDVDRIATICYGYRVDQDEHGHDLMNTGGFEQIATDEEFWQVVESCEIQP